MSREHITSHYIKGLNELNSDVMKVVHLCNQEDVQERLKGWKVNAQYEADKVLYRLIDVYHNRIIIVWSISSDQITQKGSQETTTMI